MGDWEHYQIDCTSSDSSTAEKSAWYTTFFIENHLDYLSYPDHVSSPEQVRFMVYTQPGEMYYPCSDRMFSAIMARQKPDFLIKRYKMVLEKILKLIDEQIEDDLQRQYLTSLIVTKFEHETKDGIMIPSRLEKRLLHIFLNQTQIEDPYLCEKARYNMRMAKVLAAEAFDKALDQVSYQVLAPPPKTLDEIKMRADRVRLMRLLSLTGHPDLWQKDVYGHYEQADYEKIFETEFTGDGLKQIQKMLIPLPDDISDQTPFPARILWLANNAGEVIIDLAIIRFLTSLGHAVIVALKEGPLFMKTDIYDAHEDETLQDYLKDAYFIENPDIAKNDLVALLKSEKRILVLSDGTKEGLNLPRTTATFARAFKEADLVIARGHEQRRRFFDTHFGFTQDILSLVRTENGQISILFKPRHASVIKFSHKGLEEKAGAIISDMQDARDQGMTVMFYSGIIGSIPGKIEVAKKIMTTFIEHLANETEDTFIINPGNYYEPGMDADDLMYMWEIVQRSGLIDIWRFQTYDDIVHSFTINNEKIPPEWVGKDATFSTGCTKEIKIAIDVAKKYPEMQIIGPPEEKFYRRKDYGIGKMYDRRLTQVCKL